MIVVGFVRTELHAHIRIKQSVLLKMIIKPTSSKAHQVGLFFARTIYPGEVTPPTMFSRIRVQAHKRHWHAQFTDVLLMPSTTDRFRYSCESIIGVCPSVSGDVQHGPHVVFALKHLLSPSMDSEDDPLHAQGTQAISTVSFHLSLS